MGKKLNDNGYDHYAKYHRIPGDTSEGKWLTVVLCAVGVILSALSFWLYLKYKDVTVLMIALCLLDLGYAYVELSQLYIRKYWFRYHRRIAVLITLLIYWVVIFAVACVIKNVYTIDLSPIYLPFVTMPAIIVVAVLGFLFLHVYA